MAKKRTKKVFLPPPRWAASQVKIDGPTSQLDSLPKEGYCVQPTYVKNLMGTGFCDRDYHDQWVAWIFKVLKKRFFPSNETRFSINTWKEFFEFVPFERILKMLFFSAVALVIIAYLQFKLFGQLFPFVKPYDLLSLGSVMLVINDSWFQKIETLVIRYLNHENLLLFTLAGGSIWSRH